MMKQPMFVASVLLLDICFGEPGRIAPGGADRQRVILTSPPERERAIDEISSYEAKPPGWGHPFLPRPALE
jgi:hypothetical protein